MAIMLGYLLLLALLALATAMWTEESCRQGDVHSPGCQAFNQSLFSSTMSLLPGKSSLSLRSFSPTVDLDTIELAEYFGYGAERHPITSEDGYILEVHRIYSKQVTNSSKPVVLVHHALLMNSRDLLILGPGKALGYTLADAGYDVWLCNARGSTYSRRHITISPDSKEFWDFSYTEYAIYDLPAVIDYALKTTGRSKVHYIGHSVGTINFLIMGSKRPEVLPKVQSYTALAPLTTATNGRSPVLQALIRSYRIIAAAFEAAGSYEILPHRKFFTVAGDTVCNDHWYTQAFCLAFLFSVSGDTSQFDNTILPEVLAHTPSGSSSKTFRHFGQNFYNGFREYNYGARENLKRYNSIKPPLFDYSKIKVPSQLFYGVNDLLADYTGALEICKTLPNVFRCEAVKDEKFGHLDFVWARNAPTLVYESLLDGLRRSENL